jgi:glycogen debranching enzyme
MATRPDERISATDDPRTVVEVDGRYFILATSAPADENDRVLKHGESFAIFDRWGDIKPVGLGEEGLYHRGTRHLSGLRLRVGDERPLLLGSTTRRDNSRLTIDLANPDMTVDGQLLRSGTIHLSRMKVLWAAACHERIEIRNFGGEAVTLPISLRFAADYADIFEVRGMERPARGSLLEPRTEAEGIVLAYDGLDGVRRTTRIGFAPAPDMIDARGVGYRLDLPPGRAVHIELRVDCEAGTAPRPVDFASALERGSAEIQGRLDRSARISSSSELFDDWVGRSLADVVMMTSETADGSYPYAGIPWFSTVFGRDGLITAFQLLWVQPSLARGVLGHLAATQAAEDDPVRDAQPGKILHEVRHGEMAAIGEVPFGRYYGSHDATPLFIMLAEAYHRHTGDIELTRGLWPNIEAALGWLDGPADPDGDGFVEYARRTPTGLVQQGWKDSHDSVFHADGRLADAPIALCEIQGYAYAARMAAATLADTLDLPDRAHVLRAQADALRARFEESFWVEELGTYGIALDGDKRLCRVPTSNPGHCLWTGIASTARAASVAAALLDESMNSGWGLRTLAAGQARYNPMSYHNGSVWPHDNAIAALGLSRYGFGEHADRIIHGLFDASRHFDLARLPELFCGFSRRPGEGPTRYPVACAPQSWASGSVFMLLQACMGLEVDATARTLLLSNARLPAFLDHLRIENIAVGETRVDLRIKRQGEGVGVEVLERSGEVSVVNVK